MAKAKKGRLKNEYIIRGKSPNCSAKRNLLNDAIGEDFIKYKSIRAIIIIRIKKYDASVKRCRRLERTK
jgi:hypothetical protein